MGQWGKIWQEAGRRLGTPLDVFDQNMQEEGLKEAGFVNISKKTYPVSVAFHHRFSKTGTYGHPPEHAFKDVA